MKNVKSEQIITLSFLLGLLSVNVQASPPDALAPAVGAIHLAAADVDDDEEDEEEEAVDYRDRVREIQQWMNRRDSERKGDAPSLNIAPTAPPAQFPRYFRNKGYDENGYRKLDEDVRVRLHDAPDAETSADAPRHYRRHAWHKRWSRHVHPRIRFSRHHGYAHAHSAGGSRHHQGHGFHAAGSAVHASRAARAYKGHEGRRAKAAPSHYAAKVRASGSKPTGHAKTAKKGRSHR